jgi:hypothetical protein
MSYRFEAGRIYRMPTHFGPAPGPRQLPGDVVIDPKRSHPVYALPEAKRKLILLRSRYKRS